MITLKEIEEKKWIYIPHPDTNFSNKKVGKYFRREGLTIFSLDCETGEEFENVYRTLEELEIIWKGILDDDGTKTSN